MLEFCEETHKYTWEKRPVVSVTQVLEEFLPFLGAERESVWQAAMFGNAVHKAAEYRDLGIDADIDPRIEPWLKGWERWKSEWLPKQKGTVIADIKTGIFSDKWYYQLGGYMELKKSGICNEKNMKKMMSSDPMVEFRAYSKTMDFAGTVDRIYFLGGKSTTLVAVQLFGDGTYKTHQSGNPAELDRYCFISMLNTWKILKKHKRLKQEVWNEYD